MTDLPADWTSLCAVVALLGLRHGLDADHLAAIDGLARAAPARGRSRCGALFSLGHGGVVIAIAAATGLAGSRWVPPAWFEWLGGVVSIGFLALLGVVNLAALWRAPAGVAVNPAGVRGRLVARLLGGAGQGAGAVLGVGALFALSFDTLSQAALFAMLAGRHGGLGHALVLGALFTLGMLVSDGLNGWWMARLIGRTDRMAVAASRAMTFVVAGLSLALAAFGALRLASPRVDGWAGDAGLLIAAAAIAAAAFGYLLACRIDATRYAARRP